MNTKKLQVALISLCFFIGHATAQVWKEGQHYEVLDEQTSTSQEIFEMYSFWCSHCFRFEQIMSELKQDYQLKDNLRKVHLDFLRSRPKEVQSYATEYFYAAKELKRETEIVKAIFDSIHVDKKAPETKDEFDAMLVAKGINTALLKNAMDSPAVIAHVKQNNEYLSNYKKHVTGVPMLVVNGRYKVKLSEDLDTDSLKQLLKWLLSQS